MPSLPLSISSQSRKKLKAFHFEAKSAPSEFDKENTLLVRHVDDLAQHHSAVALPPNDDEVEVEVQPPKTPATKLEFAHLTGNQEDALNSLPTTTPLYDYVYWQTPSQSSRLADLIRETQRCKKRARSSSPTSPSQEDKSHHFPGRKDVLNLESLSQSSKAPQHDPAMNLWNAYLDSGWSKDRADSTDLPAFAHLLTSSPQTPGTNKSMECGMRRSISMPVSGSKRRRTAVNKPSGKVLSKLAHSREVILASHNTTEQRMLLLVERIDETISRRWSVEHEAPSSSSPLPDWGDTHPNTSVSPVPNRSPTTVQQRQMPSGGPAMFLGHPQAPQAVTTACDSNLSDYGDDGIDDDLCEAAERIATQENRPPNISKWSANHQAQEGSTFQEQSHVDQPVPQPQRESIASLQHDLHIQSSKKNEVAGREGKMLRNFAPEQPNLHRNEGASQQALSDEFDGDDFDTGAEMENLVVQYESQSVAPIATTAVPSLRATVEEHPLKGVNMQPNGTCYELEDDFDEDDELFDQIDDGSMFTQLVPSVRSTGQRTNLNRAIKRYLIVDVIESDYETDRGRTQREKILSVKEERTVLLKIIVLRQSWYLSRCTKGSYIHLIGEFDQSNQCIVDDANNMIILHPDHLISATVVADSFTCTRRAVLQDRVKATGAAEQAQAYGHILHEIFGEAFKENVWDTDRLKDIIENVLSSYIETLYEINVQPPEAAEYLMSKVSQLQAWAATFVSADPEAGGELRDRHNSVASMRINKLLEVEEHIWSPMYGLKGNVDATVQVVMKTTSDSACRTLTVPLEFKTGKNDTVETHRAQTQLYTLLLSDRYDVNVACGVLYYLETSKTLRIPSIRHEIRQMIIQRNELACYVRNKLELPPMIQKEFTCKNCFAQTSCFTYHRLTENGDSRSSGMGEHFKRAVNHLKPVHQEFFKKWDELLTQEERDAMKFRRELWTMLSFEREVLGRCFGSVIIEPGSASEAVDNSKINRYQYTFVKAMQVTGFSFTDSQLTIGEPIVISDEEGHFALANGYITNVRPTRIMVAVDRRLHSVRRRCRNFHAENNQVFRGIMEVQSDDTPRTPAPPDSELPMLFRLDKDEFSNGMATARNNIIRIMEKDLFRARELRQLIIEGMAPTFKPTSTAYTLTGPASQQDLNVDQRRAIEKVMTAKEYALVLGMPGTGKTTMIAHIIRALVSQKKSVLLTSYTHTAVDNILLKIKDDNIPILRLGPVGKVHPEVQTFADLAGIPKKTIAELETSYNNSRVVATTCLGINQPIFNSRIFDYCIVDEASQITLPVCLGPIRMARTFILVGDHYQLPPLVQNKEAQQGGLDVSLFKMLSDSQPDSVVNLEHQYRMAEDIMLLSNELIYSGRLKCGTPGVASRLLHIPSFENGLAAHHHTLSSITSSTPSKSICLSTASCWLRRALTPQSRCLFLNTDSLGPAAQEVVSGSRITNPTETTLTTYLVTTLISAGLDPSTIGIITFYRSQLALLRADIKAVAGTVAAADLEMHTVDKFQGRDKEVIVLSCVRSNEARIVGELLRDWRRVNVAVTRARSKLLIVGSLGTLEGSGTVVLAGLARLMRERGWVVELPEQAIDGHVFECASQRSERVLGGKGREAQSSIKKKSKCSLSLSLSTVGEEKENAMTTPLRSSWSQDKAGTRGTFRKPAKVVRGGVDVERVLDKRPVMRDIVNGI